MTMEGGHWISIVAGAGGFFVALQSIYLGYRLFLEGATGAFKFSAQSTGATVTLESVAPGIALAFFGAAIAIYTIRKLMGPQRSPK